MKEYDVFKASESQKTYCKEKEYPHFAPSNGKCYRCNKNIYEQLEHEQTDWKTGEVVRTYVTGISIEEAGSELITGCPHCHYSYCE